MKKTLLLIFVAFLGLSVFAQDSDKKEKTKKEKTEKTKKTKKEKTKKDKKSDDFVYDHDDSDDYKLEDRQEVTKPSMPLYSVEQPFNQKKKKKKQQSAYMNQEYYFPAKPKNAWSLGVNGGLAMVNGDIQKNLLQGRKPFFPGYTFGLNVKKSWTYLFSTRLGYHFMEAWNTEGQVSTASSSFLNPNLTGDYTPGQLIFHNSHTVMHDANFDLMLTFGNRKHHKERAKVLFNVYASIGGLMFRSWSDHLDANGNPYAEYNVLGAQVVSGAISKGDAVKELEEVRDGTYETTSQVESAGKWKGYNIVPAYGGGAEIAFRLGRVVDLEFGGRFMATTSDLLEGLQYAEPIGTGTQADLTPENDTYVTITTGLTFKLVGKKKTEPLSHLNPMHYTYQKIAENNPESAIEDLLKDDDEDGVPNRLDQEEDTPKDAPVDPKGRALDSDKDGVIDLNDEEPFSPPGYDVDANGVAQIPAPEVPKNEGLEFTENYCSSLSDLPSVHFDKDKYFIKPEFYAHLHQVAEKILLCDGITIVALGSADKDYGTDYNQQLSWNRVNMVIDYLTENYGIDRNRFIVNFEGEANADGNTAYEEYQDRKVSFRLAKEGETGVDNPDAPFPSIKAGKDK